MRDDGKDVETDVFKKKYIVVHHNKELYKGYWTRVHVNTCTMCT